MNSIVKSCCFVSCLLGVLLLTYCIHQTALAAEVLPAQTVQQSDSTHPLHDLPVYSLTASLGLAVHRAEVFSLPGLEYLSTTPLRHQLNWADRAWSAGADISWLLSRSIFNGSSALPVELRASLRGDVYSLNGTLSADERALVNVLVPNTSPVNPQRQLTTVTLRQWFTSSLLSLGVAPMLVLQTPSEIAADMRWHVLTGMRIGYLLNSQVRVERQILEPAFATLVSSGLDRRIDTVVTSYRGFSALSFDAVIALRAMLPVSLTLASTSWHLGVEVLGQFGLTPLVQGALWNASSVRVGIVVATNSLFMPSPSVLSSALPSLPRNVHDTALGTASTSRPYNTGEASTAAPVNAASERLAKAVVLPQDTVYTRDTTVRLVAWHEQDTVRLLERKDESARIATALKDKVVLHVREYYERSVPKPRPTLIATLDVRFVSVGNNSKISETKQASKLVSEPLHVHEFLSLPDTIVLDRQSVLMRLIPPYMRFYPTIIAETGIKSAEIHIAQVLPSGERWRIARLPVIATSASTTLPQKTLQKTSIDWNVGNQHYSAVYAQPDSYLRDILVPIDVVADTCAISSDSKFSVGSAKSMQKEVSVSLECRMVVNDNAGQRALSDAVTVTFVQKIEPLQFLSSDAEFLARTASARLHITPHDTLRSISNVELTTRRTLSSKASATTAHHTLFYAVIAVPETVPENIRLTMRENNDRVLDSLCTVIKTLISERHIKQPVARTSTPESTRATQLRQHRQLKVHQHKRELESGYQRTTTPPILMVMHDATPEALAEALVLKAAIVQRCACMTEKSAIAEPPVICLAERELGELRAPDILSLFTMQPSPQQLHCKTITIQMRLDAR